MTFFGLLLGLAAFGLVFLVLLFVVIITGNKRKKAKIKCDEYLSIGKYYEALKLMQDIFDDIPVNNEDRKSNLWVIDKTSFCLEKLKCDYKDVAMQNSKSFTEKSFDYDLSLKSDTVKKQYRDERASIFEPFIHFLKSIASTNSVEELKSLLKEEA